jgi:hypothetical protein
MRLGVSSKHSFLFISSNAVHHTDPLLSVIVCHVTHFGATMSRDYSIQFVQIDHSIFDG